MHWTAQYDTGRTGYSLIRSDYAKILAQALDDWITSQSIHDSLKEFGLPDVQSMTIRKADSPVRSTVCIEEENGHDLQLTKGELDKLVRGSIVYPQCTQSCASVKRMPGKNLMTIQLDTEKIRYIRQGYDGLMSRIAPSIESILSVAWILVIVYAFVNIVLGL